MIERPTVLVLGAGASIPYGFPSGHRLKKKIITTSPHEFVPSLTTKGVTEKSWRVKCEQFCDDLKLSSQPSVDAFLERRPKDMELGKQLIAHVLISCENRNSLCPADPDWYQYLWWQMDRDFDAFRENKLAVITFNYDRSLEQFLLTALMKSYDKSLEEAAVELKSIPIIHVYGQLGLLEWQANDDQKADVRPYDIERTRETIKIAARGIQILSEGQGESAQFRKAHDLLIAAERVYFLGFGYNETNMERLKLPLSGTPCYDSQRRMFGSSYGRTVEENNVTQIKYQPLIKLRNPAYNAYDFLRHEESFLGG